MAASANRASWSVTGLARIVAERGRDLRPQEIERVLAYPADDSLYLSLARGGGLRGEDDQQPEEVRVALERADGSRHHPGQVLRGAPGPPGQVGQVGEEAVGAAFHDGEQDPVLGAEGRRRACGLRSATTPPAASTWCAASTCSARTVAGGWPA